MKIEDYLNSEETIVCETRVSKVPLFTPLVFMAVFLVVTLIGVFVKSIVLF